MTDARSGPNDSSSSPESVRARLAVELREAVSRGESPKLREYAKRFGLSVSEIGSVLDGIRASASAFDARTEETAAKAAPAGPPPLPPDYEVLGELGRGAMGVVYRARQRSLGRSVAVKVLRPGDALFVNLADRFRREVKALARLRHLHIVAVHEVGESAGHLFFAMDLVEGGSLADLIAKGEMTPTRAVKLMTQVASAIAYTHSHGLAHRDLKPGNILVDEKGDAFVVDFGLARDLAVEGQLTGTGQILGTPQYMSPEQAKGDAAAIGELSDVYAMGAVLYECLTLRPPFGGASLVDTIRAVAQDEPVAPRKIDPRIPRDLEVIVQTAMAKEPQRRYPSARAFQEDLERFVAGLPIQARPAGAATRVRRWAQRNPATAVSLTGTFVMLVVALGITAWFLAEVTQERNDKSAALAREKSEREAKEAALADAMEARVAESKAREEAEAKRRAAEVAQRRGDGARLLAQATAAAGVDPGLSLVLAVEGERRCVGPEADDALRNALLRCRERRTLPGMGRVESVRMSPDSRFVAALGAGSYVMLCDVATGGRRWLWRPNALVRLRGLTRLAFTRDGRSLVVAAKGKLAVLDASDGAVVRELLAPRPDVEIGEILAASQETGVVATSKSDGAVLAWSLSTGAGLPWSGRERGAARLSADGTKLIVRTDDRVRVISIPGGEALTDQAIAAFGGKAHDVAFVGGRACVLVTTEGTGSSTTAAQMVQVRDAGTGDALATVALGAAGEPREVTFGPAGRVALVRADDEQLWIWDVAAHSSTLMPLAETADARRAFASPDDRVVVTYKSASSLRLWDAASGALLGELDGHVGDVRVAAFGPDARSLVTAADDATVRVWDVAAPRPCATLSWGSREWLSAVGFLPGDRSVYVCGTTRTRVFDLDSSLQVRAFEGTMGTLAPDGKTLAMISGRRTTSAGDPRIFALCHGAVLDLEGDEPATTLERHGGAILCVDVAADGRRFATGGRDGECRVWDAATGRRLATVPRTEGSVIAARFAPVGDRMLTASDRGMARAWDLSEGREVWRTPEAPTEAGYTASLTLVEPSPDGTRVVVAWGDGRALVCEADSGLKIADLAGRDGYETAHRGRISTIAFSPDGRVFATGSEDQSVRVWRALSGRPLLDLPTVGDPIASVGFSPDGTLLFGASRAGATHVWRAADGHVVARLACPRGRRLGDTTSAIEEGLHLAAFSSDSRRIATTYWDGTVVVWPISPRETAASAVPRRLSTAERERYLGPPNPGDPAVAEARLTVARILAEAPLREEAQAALDARTGLDDEVRAAAQSLVEALADDPDALNAAAWSVVTEPDRSAEQFGRALRWAEAGARFAPGDAYIVNTYGVAQYRAGDFAGAAKTLARSNQINGGDMPADLAFLAMSHARLGRSDEARKTLDLLREVMKSEANSANEEAQGFLREAEKVVGK